MNCTALLVESWARERPRDPALVHEGRVTTVRELDTAVNRLANGLRSLGIDTGDRVAIMLPNTPEFVTTFHACQKIGAVAVPFNTMYKGLEILHILRDSGAKAVVCLTNFVPLINELLPELPALEQVIATGERTVTLADPDSTLFVQAVLTQSLFEGIDDAYRRVGEALVEALDSIGLRGTWYKHRGSLRIGGRKLAGFVVSQVDDLYIINVLCFVDTFDATDFLAAMSVPPEVKDKILEPLTSVREALGRLPENDEIETALIDTLQKRFRIPVQEGRFSREERFGYEKQRALAFRTVQKTEPGRSLWRRVAALVQRGRGQQ